jgi:hypothetical protein
MPTKLTVLQPYDGGRIVVDADTEGWHIEPMNGDHGLGDRVAVQAGSYEARVRATTTQLGQGGGFAIEVFVFALEDGSIRGVRTLEAAYEPPG